MSVRIELGHALYTSFDELRGKVVLTVPKSFAVTAIIVKLEADCNSLILKPGQKAPLPGNQSQVPSETIAVVNAPKETHKLLYEVKQLLDERTLAAGTHDFDFAFGLPLTNHCVPPTASNVSRFFARVQEPVAHVVQRLPPSWEGIPNCVAVQYYVKVTVQRSRFHENLRFVRTFKFLPLEPPRPLSRGARTVQQSAHGVTATLSLPEPPILTLGQAIPLRVVVSGAAVLVGLQVALIGYSHVRAESERLKDAQRFALVARALELPLAGDVTLDPAYWDVLVPDLPPSFSTCNVQRFYGLEVGLTLRDGHTYDIVQRVAVSLYSGRSIHTDELPVYEEPPLYA